jgi:hypothetical protein
MKKLWIGIGIAIGCLLAAGIGVRALKKRAANMGGSGDSPAAVASVRALKELEIAETAYDGKLASGWDDWGWGPHELGGGPARIVFEGYGGIILHHGELQWRYGGLAFRYKAPEEYADFLQVSLRWQGAPDDAFPVVAVEPRHVAPLPDGWREVLVEWKELNPAQRAFDRVMISSRNRAGPCPRR